MSETTLSSLIHILALLAKTRKNSEYIIEKNMIISFLQAQFTQNVVGTYTNLFEDYYKSYKFNSTGNDGHIDIVFEKINLITQNISKTLTHRQRIFIIVNLFEFSKYLKNYLELENSLDAYYRYIKRTSENFKIRDDVHHNCKFFSQDDFHLIPEKYRLLVISGKKLGFVNKVKNLVIENINGLLYVLKFDQEFLLIKYKGNDILYLDNRILKSDTIYFFSISSSLYGSENQPLFYNDINKAYADSEPWHKLLYVAQDIEHSYKNSANGIKPFSLTCESNELVGIIGSSGSGKTTLLNLLNGSLPVQKGKIDINGYQLNEHFLSKGLIGYVPQDDLLIEELTVFENLYYGAKLGIGWESDSHLRESVKDILEILQLSEAKDLKVGSALQKIISGGQRKRLNIALELIREPVLFFIDEPTSGLSSTDSYHIIHMLKQQALKQKLLFVNIHQPSNEVFYLFDIIIILDKGGYPVYKGRAGDALEYFRNSAQHIETITTGKYQTEQEEILSILEETFVDDFGNVTTERLVKPEEWYQRFLRHDSSVQRKETKVGVPGGSSIIPKPYLQFKTYFMRNFRAKMSDNQYKLMAIVISPLLAFILSFLCKQHTGTETNDVSYIFSRNDNLAAFYFMSIIVAMFVGLIVSAEEVHKDKKLFIRERFLNLSKLSYFASKLALLLLLSLFQTGSYVIISLGVLNLSCNIWIFWATLFLTSVLANVLGLCISKFLNSLVAIYIAIPLVLVPQILLSGVVVRYEKLHPFVSSQKYVPVVGDLMPTRWGYEVLIVNQFKNNPYENHLFYLNREESYLSYASYIQLPELARMIKAINKPRNDIDSLRNSEYIEIIINELKEFPLFEIKFNQQKFDWQIPSKEMLSQLVSYVNLLEQKNIEKLNLVLLKKDSLMKSMEHLFSDPGFKEKNYNRSIADLVLDRNSLVPFKISNGRIIRFFEPAFYITSNPLGRSHLYATTKRIGRSEINTINYNIFIILLMILTGFIILNTELPEKIKETIILLKRDTG